MGSVSPGLRTVASYNHSCTQRVASVVDSSQANSPVPVASPEPRQSMLLTWLAGNDLTPDQNRAVSMAMWAMDRPGTGELESNRAVPAGVRLIVAQAR
jgi:hypothetical protein